MSLHSVWIRTLGDGLIRADQVIGITTHRTPSLTGKPGHWLLTAALSVPTGSGNADGWDLTSLHRTLLQTDTEPRHAPEALARVLATLAGSGTAGILTPVLSGPDRAEVRFDFTPFDQAGGNGHGSGGHGGHGQTADLPLTKVITRDSVGVG